MLTMIDEAMKPNRRYLDTGASVKPDESILLDEVVDLQ